MFIYIKNPLGDLLQGTGVKCLAPINYNYR